MSRYVKIALISFAVAVRMWFTYFIYPARLEFVCGVAAVLSTLIAVNFLAISIGQRRGWRWSPYRIFAIVNAALALGVAAYAIYDLQTATGWFAGLVGALLLIVVLPIIAALLLADLSLWLCKRRREKREQLSLPERG